jgi:nitroreductase
MELDEAIRLRRMYRDFSPEPIDAGVVDRLLDRARRAPSAGHTQGWSFLVLDERESLERFWRVAADPAWLEAPSLPGLLRAPVVIVPWCSRAAYLARYSEPDKSAQPDLEVPYWLVDTSFAVMLLLLGVVAEGLGALFFRLRPGVAEGLRRSFEVPPEWSPLGALAVGRPVGDGGPGGSAGRGRKPLVEVVHRGRWHG